MTSNHSTASLAPLDSRTTELSLAQLHLCLRTYQRLVRSMTTLLQSEPSTAQHLLVQQVQHLFSANHLMDDFRSALAALQRRAAARDKTGDTPFRQWSKADFTQRMKQAKKQLSPYEAQRFISFWTAPTTSGRMLFATRKHFNMEMRLAHWTGRATVQDKPDHLTRSIDFKDMNYNSQF